MSDIHNEITSNQQGITLNYYEQALDDLTRIRV